MSNEYTVDPNSSVELSRLLRQDEFFTQKFGYFPPHLKEDQIHSVLDLGCGPGAWLLGYARRYPMVSAFGIDISGHMINFAKKMAEVEQLSNVHLVAQPFETLPYEDESMDYIQARFVQWFLPPQNRFAILKEWLRVLKPGGWLRFVSCSFPMTNGEASQLTLEMFFHGMQNMGKTPSSLPFAGKDELFAAIYPNLSNFAIKDYGEFMLEKYLLTTLGCQNIQQDVSIFDQSVNSPDHEFFVQNAIMSLESHREFHLRNIPGLTPQLFKQLSDGIQQEMQSPEFVGFFFGISSSGQKLL